MTTWQERVPGCFGCEDKKFAQHALDEGRAKELKEQLDQEKISWALVEKEIKNFLSDCTADHIETEVKEAKRLLCLNTERT
ncbi:MAG: hypothetical protein HS120_09540 [Burkholderiales bacterium]|nr:hypothetical protein [Burkholderiales bacterium]